MEQQSDHAATTTMQSGVTAPSRLSALAQFWPVRLIAYLGAMLLVVVLTKLLSLPFVPPSSSPAYEVIVTARNILQAAAMIAVYAFLVQKLERRTSIETAVRGAANSLLTGFGMGSGLIIIVYLILYGLGIAQFHSGTGLAGVVVALLKPAVIGTLEELVFRVILFRIFQHMAGTLPAVILSAALFGVAHMGNPGATPLSMVFLSVEMGVFLALVFVLTRSLWVVAGSHMGWNFALGFIFGSDVSGLDASSSLISTTLKGPALLTGGAFGPEGSIITLGVSVIASVAVIRLIARRNLWQPTKFEMREKPSPDSN